MSIQESDEIPVMPKAPDVKNPVTARPMTIAAGTKTGLHSTNSGVDSARPMSVPANVRPARRRRKPPRGKRVTTAIIFDAEGP